MEWLQSSHPMGDLPWLDPEHNPESIIDHTQSTPTLHVPPSSQASPGPSRFTSKSLIEFSPNVPEPEKELMINRLKGYTLSVPTPYDISNFHEHTTTHPSPKHPTTPDSYPRTYQSSRQTQEKRPRSSTKSTSSIQSNKSPTMFYSAPDFSSEASPPEQIITQQSSSSMFLPRGLSTGPQMVPRSRPSPIQTLLNQLSGGESGQEDQAPDLEMDMFDISLI